MVNFVFVFLGEFGYELLNWQGVVRKFYYRKEKNERLICCTRKGLESFYECADLYIDISELSLFKKSVANGYRAMNPELNCVQYNELVKRGGKRAEIHSAKNWKYVYRLHKQIKEHVQKELVRQGIISGKIKFFFSDQFHVLRGLKFGRTIGKSGDIYASLDLDNNSYAKIKSQRKYLELVENKLGFSLKEPYILCQLGNRDIVNRSKEVIDSQMIIKDLSERMKIIVLNFNTGRNMDSSSNYGSDNSCVIYDCDSFYEQSLLIENANNCVFFTEGDFRSHNYVPPFMGKNVYSIASVSVYKLPTTPIKFWNENVFRFGGRIIPVISEKLTTDGNYYNKFIKKVIE